jgi:hypothetical protein
MINLLPEEQRKDFLSMEDSLKNAGNQLAESYRQKEIENSDYTAYMAQAKADRQELKDQLSSMDPASKEYSQCQEQLDVLEQNIDRRQEEHNTFEQNLSAQEQEYIKDRQERDQKANELGIGLKNDPPSDISSTDKTKYEAIDGMLVGRIPPGDNPVEDALINNNLKREISLNQNIR